MKRLLRFLPLPAQLQARCSPVLTYHACFAQRPRNVAEADNISPNRMFDQVSWLKRRYRFVTIDEFCQAKHRRGMAAVTFDDGYKSAVNDALPVLQSLDVPCTIFVNTFALEKKTFWRHKVVYIMQNGLVEDCARSFLRTRTLTDGFYRDLKHPTNNSKVVEEEVDAFLASGGLEVDDCDHLMDDRSWFRRHPLVWYGNHSHNHYVLSSLSRQEQVEEIGKTKAVIASIPGIQTSEVFSLPFGEAHHLNEDTLAVVKECGYQALLMNQGGVNGRRLTMRYGLPVVERFSPYEAPIDIQLKKEICRSLARRLWT
jgi:peptidoglycan/xylan/chitin deacetylase (PgdA/CDA1 family)